MVLREKNFALTSKVLQSVFEKLGEGSQMEQPDSTADKGTDLPEESADRKSAVEDGGSKGVGTNRLDGEDEEALKNAANEELSERTKDNVETETEKTSRSSADDTSGTVDSVSHDDIIQRAEQRREASDLVKAAVREESERLKEIPAWENESGAQIDPRNRVGEEASKIMDEQQQASESVMERIADTQDVNQEAEPKMGVNKDSKQDTEHRERIQGKEKVQEETTEGHKDREPRSKTMKYASIDPLADQEGESSFK